MIFLLFSQKLGFEISCKLFPKETVCKRWQSPFSEKNIKKKKDSKCLQLKILPSMLSINGVEGKIFIWLLLGNAELWSWVKYEVNPLTFTTFRADSADDKLNIFFLFFLENRI